jgi:protease-4
MAMARGKIIALVVVGAGVFFLAIIFALIFAVSQSSSDFAGGGLGSKIAVVEVTGVINNSDDVVRQIKKYKDDHSIEAIVLRVDSPGGGVAASQEIYDQLLKFKEDDRHIVVSMGSVAASGGYYVSCAADKIFANPGTITGSIGVIFEFPVLQELMDKVGIKMEVIKSGALKDVGNPARKITPEEQKMLQSVIDDTYSQFVEVVSKNRHLDSTYVKSLADGSVFTGRQAMQNGLVDKMGTLDDAISAAGQMCNLGEHPRVVKERRYMVPWWEAFAGKLGLDFINAKITHQWPTLEYRYEM